MNINKELETFGFWCKRSRYNYEICKLGSTIVVNTFEFPYEIEKAINEMKNRRGVNYGH